MSEMTSLFQNLSPIARAMGGDDGDLLEMAMASMPKVIRELPSKVDIVQTFYANVNRAEKATSFQSGLSLLGVVLCEDLYIPEDSAAEGA
jgi:hypothetical protein